jgi:cysteine dioxygenase
MSNKSSILAATDLAFGPGEGVSGLVEQLTSFERPLSRTELLTVVGDADIDEQSVQQWAIFDDTAYRRNRVLRTAHFELLVLCWRPEQMTPIHDHTGSTGVVRVLKGEATEIRYMRSRGGLLVPQQSRVLARGELLTSRESDIHQVGNLGGPEESMITLHCYSRPLDGMQVFDRRTTCFREYDQTLEATTRRLSEVTR